MESHTGIDSDKNHGAGSQASGTSPSTAADQANRKHIEHYDFLKQVGEGAFGYVYLAREKSTQQLCAVKVLEKAHIIKYEKTKSVYREKDILMKFAFHPNIIKLDSVFQVK